MSQKPKRARRIKQPRLGHEYVRPDGSIARYVSEEDDDQQQVRHYRTVDSLSLMLKNGSITEPMHDAGQHFAQEFSDAFAGGVASPTLDAIPTGTAPGELLLEKNTRAARSVRQAINAVGGSSSPAGSALWFVTGLGLSVREWALRHGWSERPITQPQANGILVAALGVLARYYGYERGE